MQAVSAPSLANRFSRATERVAVVAPEASVVERIGAALGDDAVGLGCSAAAVADLADDVGQAVTLVLVGGPTACGCQKLIRAARGRFPDVPVVLVARLTPIGVHKAIGAGALGLVLESQVESALAATIRAVRAGQVVTPRALRRSVVRPALSHRERQTLALVVNGLTNREIAARLFLAESTVKTHLTSVFSKLGVGSRSEAVALALDPEEKLGLEAVGLMPVAAPVTIPAEVRS
jgi:DNA-binding NarL/FixJ family response regulator